MNIQPKSGPSIAQPQSAKVSAREAAIAKLTELNAQQSLVKNQSQIAPEEMTAISTTSPKQQTTQNNTSDGDAQPAAESVVSEVTPKPAAKEEALSSQYALLARKEKALRLKVQQQEQASKAKEEALRIREEALKSKESEYQSNYIQKSRLKSDPLSVLAEEGVSYEELTKAILNPQLQQDPRMLAELERIKAEIDSTKKQQEQITKNYEEQQKQAYNQAVNQIRNDVKQLVMTDSNFETIKATNSVNDVVDLIEKTFQKDGIILSVEEAAVEVENYLVDEAIKLANLNKIKSRLQPAAPATKQVPAQDPNKQQQPQMKTLTHAINASARLSARDRALLAFKGQLKD